MVFNDGLDAVLEWARFERQAYEAVRAKIASQQLGLLFAQEESDHEEDDEE